jgi:hypothetical protein
MSTRIQTADSWIRFRCGLLAISATIMLLTWTGCTKPKPMDIVWSSDLVDPNGLARNPIWQQQKQSGSPPAVCDFCPCDNANPDNSNQDPKAWTNARNCTDATLETNGGSLCFGHWNWLPVEYEGVVNWSGHSNSVYDDDDYYFNTYRDAQKYNQDHALYTAYASTVELEFDSDETVDYWDDTGTWWDDFHHNYVDDNDNAAHGHIDGKEVIIIGLAGLDAQHSVHTELHPVYAMFVHVQDDPSDDRWAFFVRNWGDEGFCADHQEYFYPPGRKVQVLLRHAGANNVIVGQNVWVYGDDEDDYNQQSWGYQPTNDGLLLTFNLQDPSKQDGFVGDLNLNWTGTIPGPPTGSKPKSPLPQTKPSSPAPEAKEQDALLREKFLKLDPAAQKELVKRLKALDHPPPARKKMGTKGTAVSETAWKPTGKSPTYSYLKAAPDSAGNARRAKHREAAMAFFKEHGVN